MKKPYEPPTSLLVMMMPWDFPLMACSGHGHQGGDIYIPVEPGGEDPDPVDPTDPWEWAD